MKWLLNQVLPGTFRRGRPRETEPEKLLELYSFEGCPSCRRVRRVLTELELDFIHRSAPNGGRRNRALVKERGGKEQFPYLLDPNTGQAMYESRDIVAYLLRTYG